MPEHRPGPQDSWWIPVTKPGVDRPRGVGSWFRSRMVTGLLVAFPVAITLFFARFLFNLLDRWSYPISTYLFGRAARARSPGPSARIRRATSVGS
jgi:hypothetical protein